MVGRGPAGAGSVGGPTGKASYVLLFFVAGLFAGARRMPERLKAVPGDAGKE